MNSTPPEGAHAYRGNAGQTKKQSLVCRKAPFDHDGANEHWACAEQPFEFDDLHWQTSVGTKSAAGNRLESFGCYCRTRCTSPSTKVVGPLCPICVGVIGHTQCRRTFRPPLRHMLDSPFGPGRARAHCEPATAPVVNRCQDQRRLRGRDVCEPRGRDVVAAPVAVGVPLRGLRAPRVRPSARNWSRSARVVSGLLAARCAQTSIRDQRRSVDRQRRAVPVASTHIA